MSFCVFCIRKIIQKDLCEKFEETYTYFLNSELFPLVFAFNENVAII